MSRIDRDTRAKEQSARSDPNSKRPKLLSVDFPLPHSSGILLYRVATKEDYFLSKVRFSRFSTLTDCDGCSIRTTPRKLMSETEIPLTDEERSLLKELLQAETHRRSDFAAMKALLVKLGAYEETLEGKSAREDADILVRRASLKMLRASKAALKSWDPTYEKTLLISDDYAVL